MSKIQETDITLLADWNLLECCYPAVAYTAIRKMILEESEKRRVFFNDMAAPCYDYLVDDRFRHPGLIEHFLLKLL